MGRAHSKSEISTLTRIIIYHATRDVHHYAVEIPPESNILVQGYSSTKEQTFVGRALEVHVAYIFDDVGDTAWFHAGLIKKCNGLACPNQNKNLPKKSVTFMNSKLRKAQYKRNIARNKFRRFGKKYRNENRHQRNNVVKIRKQSLKIDFGTHCIKHDKNFWKVISPSTPDKRYKNGNSIILNEEIQSLIIQLKWRKFLVIFSRLWLLASVLITPLFLLLMPYVNTKSNLV